MTDLVVQFIDISCWNTQTILLCSLYGRQKGQGKAPRKIGELHVFPRVSAKIQNFKIFGNFNGTRAKIFPHGMYKKRTKFETSATFLTRASSDLKFLSILTWEMPILKH